MNAGGNERIEISLDDLADDDPSAANSARAGPGQAIPLQARTSLPELPTPSTPKVVGVEPARPLPPARGYSTPPAADPPVSLSTALEVLAGIIAVGLIIKVSVIGYYPDELPMLAVGAGIVLVLGWLGQFLDH